VSSSASTQVVRQALNKVGELNQKYPPVSEIHSNPDILLRKSQMDSLGKKLKELHKAAWEDEKSSGSIPHWLGPVSDLPPLLIEKGCEDHLMHSSQLNLPKGGRNHLPLDVCLHVQRVHVMMAWAALLSHDEAE